MIKKKSRKKNKAFEKYLKNHYWLIYSLYTNIDVPVTELGVAYIYKAVVFGVVPAALDFVYVSDSCLLNEYEYLWRSCDCHANAWLVSTFCWTRRARTSLEWTSIVHKVITFWRSPGLSSPTSKLTRLFSWLTWKNRSIKLNQPLDWFLFYTHHSISLTSSSSNYFFKNILIKKSK